MRKKYQQMSLLDTYKSVEERLENNKAELFVLLDEHLDCPPPQKTHCLIPLAP